MKYEIESAVEFLTSNLTQPHHSHSAASLAQTTSPQDQTQKQSFSSTETLIIDKSNLNVNFDEKMEKMFRNQLSKTLAKKFASHWYEEEPIKGQAFRSILVDFENNFVDKIILTSAKKVHINKEKFDLLFNNLRNKYKFGFQMWIDPGEVEVEFLSPSSIPPSSSSSSPSSLSPYRSSNQRVSNQILYSIRQSGSQSKISRPPSPPSSSSPPPSLSSSPPSSFLSSSPPSSPISSSYSPISPDAKINSIFSPGKNIKPIRISVRQNDENVEENKMSIEFNDHLNNTSVKNTFAIPQPAM